VQSTVTLVAQKINILITKHYLNKFKSSYLVNGPEQSEVLNSYPYQKFVDFSYSEMVIFVTLCLGGFSLQLELITTIQALQ
jgi:hypothetical protein